MDTVKLKLAELTVKSFVTHLGGREVQTIGVPGGAVVVVQTVYCPTGYCPTAACPTGFCPTGLCASVNCPSIGACPTDACPTF